MFYFRVCIAYKGTHYYGWQAQSVDTENESKPTIEGTILKALKKIANYQACTISAASRTDGGVHAQGQIAKIRLPIKISAEHLLLKLNNLLPSDIRILTCQSSSQAYQPSKTSQNKEYHYYFSTSLSDNVMTSDIALHLPLFAQHQDSLALLRQGCQLFVGRHDFYNFSQGNFTQVQNSGASSIREIYYCDIHQAEFAALADNIYYLKVVGNGFLKFMVRYLMGTLIELGKGRIELADISCHLAQHQEVKLAAKAKAKGLHLIKIEESPIVSEQGN